MNISIRAETPGDIDAIARLTEAAFRNETHSSHTEQYIVDALRRAGALTLSLVAEANGQVIGHIAASPVTIDGEAGDWYGLAPLSVAPGRQRQGLGSQLVRRLLTELRLLPAGGCVVLGRTDLLLALRLSGGKRPGVARRSRRILPGTVLQRAHGARNSGLPRRIRRQRLSRNDSSRYVAPWSRAQSNWVPFWISSTL